MADEVNRIVEQRTKNLLYLKKANTGVEQSSVNWMNVYLASNVEIEDSSTRIKRSPSLPLLLPPFSSISCMLFALCAQQERENSTPKWMSMSFSLANILNLEMSGEYLRNAAGMLLKWEKDLQGKVRTMQSFSILNNHTRSMSNKKKKKANIIVATLSCNRHLLLLRSTRFRKNHILSSFLIP